MTSSSVGVDRGGVAEAAVLGDRLGDRDRVLDAGRAHQPQHRHQLLGGERVRDERLEVAGQRREQHLVVDLGLEPREGAEVEARLADGLQLDGAVVEGRGAQRRHLLLGQQPCAQPLELGQHRVPHRLVDDARLLGRADHGRVEGLGDQHVDRRHPDVGAAVDVDRRVARTDAQARLARRVGGRDRLRAAGGPDEVDAGVVEEVLRGVERRVGDDLKGVRRHAGGLAGRLEQLDGPLGAARRARRRAEDHRVARLGRDDRLEQHGRGRVGDRGEREHDADRLGDVGDRPRGVLLDHADGALVLEVVVQELGGDVVLDHLVLEHAEAGVLHRQARELDRVLEAGDHERVDDPVDASLVVDGAEATGGKRRALDVAVEPLCLVGRQRRSCALGRGARHQGPDATCARSAANRGIAVPVARKVRARSGRRTGRGAAGRGRGRGRAAGPRRPSARRRAGRSAAR